MKLTKWGGRSFDKPQTAYMAVVVLAYVEGKLQYRWVTDIWYQGRKEWVAENHKKAYLFEKKHAEEFVMALAWNGTTAWTATVFPDSVPENNW